MKINSLTLSLLLCAAAACSQQSEGVPINNIQEQPRLTAADSSYANVYKPLDGTWKGVFKIYEDTARGPRLQSLFYDIDSSSLQRSSLRFQQSIEVTQVYESLSPFFQTVRIRDYYPQQDKTVVSEGVNKVQDGQMWCVVRKPDETVIHEGSLQGAHTIIWQRDEEEPQKIEYFRETVQEDSYEIVGWGYYQGDDTSLMPRFWFYSNYQRQ